VFDRRTGVLTQMLTDPAPSSGDAFGASVLFIPGMVLVSAPFADVAATDAGLVYVFDGQSGELINTLHSPRPSAGGHFGLALALFDSTVLVGAPGEASDAGAVYWFDLDRGTSGEIPYVGAGPAAFGSSIAVSGESMIIGAPLEDQGSGAIYLFDIVQLV